MGDRGPTWPISTVKELSRLLQCRVAELDKFARNPTAFYFRNVFVSKMKRREGLRAKPRLTDILRRLNSCLQALPYPAFLQGGLRGRSIVGNAKLHTRRTAIVKYDIRDFFDSISTARVRSMFKRDLRCSAEVADLLAAIATPFDKLPQGAPHSVVVANLVILPLARRLHGLAVKHAATYTQFIDDITISGPRHLEKLMYLIGEIIRDEGFEVATEKTAVEVDGIQSVTGIRVDNGLDAPPSKIKSARDAVAAAKSTPGLSDQEIQSIEGKIAHIANLNRGAGRALQKRWRKSSEIRTRRDD